MRLGEKQFYEERFIRYYYIRALFNVITISKRFLTIQCYAFFNSTETSLAVVAAFLGGGVGASLLFKEDEED